MSSYLGGPLVIKGATQEEDVQIGVTSWGVGCAFLPGVFSRVSMGYEWIQEEVCDEGDGSTDPPGYMCGTAEPTKEPTKSPTPSKCMVRIYLLIQRRCLSSYNIPFLLHQNRSNSQSHPHTH